MVSRLAWGVAGCGWVARDYVAPAIMAASNARLAALYDPRAGALEGFGGAERHTDLASFLATPGLGAVYVAAPNDAHRALVEAAAGAGLAVLCEKPMATSLDDARAMVAACERAGVLYATAFDQRFHPAHRHLAAMVAAEAIGTVTAIRIVYACWVGAAWAADNWRIDPARAGGGALFDLAPHGLDLSGMILGETLVDVRAMGQRRVHRYAVEDGALLTAQSESGVLVQMHVAYNCPEALPRRRLEVVGTRGQITATDTMGQTPGGTLTLVDDTGRTHAVPVPDAERSPFLGQIEAFSAAALSGRPFAFSPAHDLHVMELLMRAHADVSCR
jgi:predicted dehydrogenase